MKTLLFSQNAYTRSFICCFLLCFFSNLIVILFFARPEIDYEAYFGSDYLLYSILNLSMFIGFILCIVILSLLIAEKIFTGRGYYEILQKEITGKDI